MYKYSNAVEWCKPFADHKKGKLVKTLLNFLANHTDRRGVAYASFPTLMRACGTGRRQLISNALKELVRLKILVKGRRMRHCNKYTLSLEGILAYSLPSRITSQLKKNTPNRIPPQLESDALSSCKNNIDTNTTTPEQEWFDPLTYRKPIITRSGAKYSAADVHRVLYWIYRDPKCPNRWYRRNVTSTSDMLRFFPKMVGSTLKIYTIPVRTQTNANPNCSTCGGTGQVEYVEARVSPFTGESLSDYSGLRDCECVTTVAMEV